MIIIFKNNKPKALLSDLITSEEFAADRWHVYTYISCSWMKIQRISTLGDGTSCVFISMVGLFKNHLCVISSIFAYFHLVFTVRGLAWIFVIGNVTCIKCHTLHFPVRSCRVDALLKKKNKIHSIHGYGNFMIYTVSGLGESRNWWWRLSFYPGSFKITVITRSKWRRKAYFHTLVII